MILIKTSKNQKSKHPKIQKKQTSKKSNVPKNKKSKPLEIPLVCALEVDGPLQCSRQMVSPRSRAMPANWTLPSTPWLDSQACMCISFLNLNIRVGQDAAAAVDILGPGGVDLSQQQWLGRARGVDPPRRSSASALRRGGSPPPPQQDKTLLGGVDPPQQRNARHGQCKANPTGPRTGLSRLRLHLPSPAAFSCSDLLHA